MPPRKKSKASHKTKKHAAPVKPKKARPKSHRRSARVSGAGMTAAQHKAAARTLLENQLGTEYVKRDNATLKSKKKKSAKKIVDIKRQIRALK